MYNYNNFLDDCKLSSSDLISKQLKLKRGLRVQFTLLCYFYLPTDEEQKLEEKNFNSSCQPIVNMTSMKQCIDEFVDDIKLIKEFVVLVNLDEIFSKEVANFNFQAIQSNF